jgi:hypothetical protein
VRRDRYRGSYSESENIMEAKPRPLLGSLLGLLLGIVVVALLWQLGVVPPDRLVLFGVLAVTIFLVTIILTQRVVLVRKRFILVTVVCGLMAGVAAAGIPSAIAGGSISDGCFAEGTSSLDSKTPDATSISDPFDMTRADSVAWIGESTGVFTDWNSSIGIDVGGFPVEIWSGSSANDDKEQSNSGVEDVATRLADIEESTGVTLAGIYHVYGDLDANEGGCDMSAYVRLPGEGAFAGTLNLVLWGTLAVLVIIILIMAGVVRRSISMAAAVAASGPTVVTGASTPSPAPPAPAQWQQPEQPTTEQPGPGDHAGDAAPGSQVKPQTEAPDSSPPADQPEAPPPSTDGNDKPEG